MSCAPSLSETFPAKTAIPFSGEPLIGLQVTGLLETRNIDFKNVIILSVNEGILPKSTVIPSLIPYNLRRGFGLPTFEHQDAIFAYYFYRLINRSEKVIMVHSSADKGIGANEKSRFVAQLEHYRRDAIKHQVYSYSISSLKTKTISVDKNKWVQQQLSEYLDPSHRGLSPSALNTMLDCSLKFYFRHIQKLKKPELFTGMVEANVFGSILHVLLQKIYQPFVNRTIDQNTLKKNGQWQAT
jgi:hypothetical protein